MKTLYYLVLVLSVLFASCDSPTDTKKSSSSRAQTTKEEEELTTEERKDGNGEEPAIPTGTTLTSFYSAEVSQVLRAPFPATYINPLNKAEVADDEGKVTYASSNTDVATVDRSTGAVKPLSVGKTTITARKAATAGKWQKSTAKYTLTIAKYKPTDKDELVAEIQKATKKELRGMKADLNYIDTSAIKDMSELFMADNPKTPTVEGYGLSAFEGNISSWDVSRVTNMRSMFDRTTKFNSDISKWNVSRVTNMSSMFSGTLFNQDISKWNVSSVIDMSSMFFYARVFDKDISKWNVSNVTNMSYMFAGTEAFNQDISSWDVSSVNDMSRMFIGAIAFKRDISSWKVKKVTNMSYMFFGASKFNQNLDAWKDRINEEIKADWAKAKQMFKNSGLKNSLPTWCETVKECRDQQK